MKNAFVAAFGAVYFYVAAKVFKYRLMSKRFFGVEFRFWAGKNATRFQFILIKKTKRAVLTNYGTKCEFSFLNLYKEIKRQLDKALKQKTDYGTRRTQMTKKLFFKGYKVPVYVKTGFKTQGEVLRAKIVGLTHECGQ